MERLLNSYEKAWECGVASFFRGASASYNAYPIFRRPTRTAVPRASGMFSPGVVARYHWSTDQHTWCALVHFTAREYETAEEAEGACATIDVVTTLTKHVSLALLEPERVTSS